MVNMRCQGALGLRSVAFRVVIVVSFILIPETRSCVSVVFANLVELSWNILRFLLCFTGQANFFLGPNP